MFHPARADLSLVGAMAQRIAHRGPDEDRSFLSPDGRCAIGFRRLAVIDPSGSHQPMASPDGQIVVAFNGEIYNFRELRRELTADGARFRTSGDTEVLLQLYERLGLNMLSRLTGMFAFALYDARAGRLMLARDRLGEKPLWYAMLNDRIIFASQARAVLKHPRIVADMDAGSISHYLTMGYIPSPKSAWIGLLKLPPARYLLAETSADAPKRYWSPRPVKISADRTERIELIRNRLSQAVQQRLVSDVPLGALLSGGIDSSIVVALMSQSVGEAGGVRTFTAGFDDVEYDERPLARLVADRYHTHHAELTIRAAPVEMLDDLVRMYDEPFGDSSALPTWLICREARKHVTAALVGDGGDEVFGGYDRYRAMRLAETIGPLKYGAIRIAGMMANLLAPHNERRRSRRLARFAASLPYPFATQYFMHRRLFGPADFLRLFTPEFIERIDVQDSAKWFCDLYDQPEYDDEVAYAQRHDIETYLPDDLLVKTDIASMAVALELRTPMLDHELVSLGLSLPTADKISGRHGKVLLREAFVDMLPPEVLQTPKHGFAVPLARWLTGELLPVLKETLLDGELVRQQICRREALAGLINDQISGRDDHRHRLWALLVLGRWLTMQHR